VLILKRTGNTPKVWKHTDILSGDFALFSYSQKCRKYPAVTNCTNIHSQKR